MQKVLLTFLYGVFLVSLGYGQGNFPENDQLYIDTVVPRIDITINPDTLAWIYAHVDSDQEFHARFIFDNGTIRDTIDPVGFRLRGNTSRYSKKKSFKVSFNTFSEGSKYYGVEHLNLNGEHNDPSIMRSKIMWDLLRKWEIPSPRSNHVQVYINGNYYGLYLNVEHIDEEFVKNRFNNKNGNLYKCTYPADLAYLGSNPDMYKVLNGSGRVYELKTNTETDDYTDLATFIDRLNHTSDENLVCELDELFNTYDYLKMMVADIFCSNWDGAIFNKNNFYLYHNTSNNKFEYIPYDVDNTFGIDWFSIDWANRYIYAWSPGGNQNRPIYDRIINQPELRKQFSYYADQMLNQTLNLDSLIQSIDQRKDLIAPYVVNDPYYPLDYGFSYEDFIASFTNNLDNHVKYGIYPYLNARKLSFNQQLEKMSMKPVIKYIQHKIQSGPEITIQAKVEMAVLPGTVKLLYRIGEGTVQQKTMEESSSHLYTVIINDFPPQSIISYQIQACDAIEQVQTLPCAPVEIPAYSGYSPRLFINEFLSSNEFTNADEIGFYSDWIEVYNGDTEPVFLGKLYLTDNLNTQDKWKMPDHTLGVGEFELFWADGDESLGDHHTNFKLSKTGEEIGIFNLDKLPVDTLTFGPQATDVSYGRAYDGGAEWIAFSQPTPKASNQSATGFENIDELNSFEVYPNPASGNTIYFNKKIDFKIYNTAGKLMYSGNNVKQVSIADFPAGLYLLVSDENIQKRLIIY